MFSSNFNNLLIKIIPVGDNWVIIYRTPQTDSIHSLTAKNIGALIPHKSQLKIKISSLEKFGKLLNLWEIKDPIKQVTKILFQDNELLRFSLRST